MLLKFYADDVLYEIYLVVVLFHTVVWCLVFSIVFKRVSLILVLVRSNIRVVYLTASRLQFAVSRKNYVLFLLRFLCKKIHKFTIVGSRESGVLIFPSFYEPTFQKYASIWAESHRNKEGTFWNTVHFMYFFKFTN